MGLGIVFSGQGNQYPQMLDKLYQHNPGAVDKLASQLGIELTPEIKLNSSDLFANHYAQPLLVGYEYLLWQELAPYIEIPVAFTGYSLGEVSSFACATGMGLSAAINLAKARAVTMIKCGGEYTSRLASVTGLDKICLTAVCEQFDCFIAINNGLEQYIIGGQITQLMNCLSYLQQLTPIPKITLLDVAVASHTQLLYDAGIEFATYLQQYKDVNLYYKVIAGVSATVHYVSTTLIDDLAKQMYTTILFDNVVQVLYELGATTILEIGPGKALSNIIKQYSLPVKVKSIDDFSSITGVINWINKNIDNE